MKGSLKLSLKAGEKVYLNGAVVRVDRKVSIELLNNVNFLLEQHVMKPEEVVTPLQQLYFIIQMLLIEPSTTKEMRPLADQAMPLLATIYKGTEIEEKLGELIQLLDASRTFEALRTVRRLLPVESAYLGRSGCTVVPMTRPPEALARAVGNR